MMTFDPQDLARLQALLRDSKQVQCVCHRGPDGDAIGSMLAMGLLIEKHFPHASVSFHCVDPAPETFQLLPSIFRIGLPFAPGSNPEALTIFLDCAEAKLTSLTATHPELFDGTRKTVMIDHHYANPKFASEVNILVSDASSTCEIITHLAEAMGLALTPDIATCLLAGVLTDTGGLLHSNTTARVYRTMAALIRQGGRRQQVVNAVFRSAKLSTLRLWGRVLEKITLTEEGGAISAVTQGDFRATGAEYSELTGAIDYVNAVPGMRFSLILSERDGQVKGSLRTLRDDVDVSAMAGKFQGGGHKRAAGFSLPGRLEPEVRWKVVEDQPAA
jgi:phosphoesterase RecJ-like protein